MPHKGQKLPEMPCFMFHIHCPYPRCPLNVPDNGIYLVRQKIRLAKVTIKIFGQKLTNFPTNIFVQQIFCLIISYDKNQAEIGRKKNLSFLGDMLRLKVHATIFQRKFDV